MRPCRGLCWADAVLGEVFSGNSWGKGGITVVQNLLQPVFKELWTQGSSAGGLTLAQGQDILQLEKNKII